MSGVDYADVRTLARTLGKVPADLRLELRPRLRAAGELVRTKVQSNAAFSSRIPAAVRLSAAFGVKTGGVRVSVDQRRVPHARPLENRGRQGTFRHPVYGNRSVWVAQAAHPFFFPAVKSSQAEVRALVRDAVRASFPKVS